MATERTVILPSGMIARFSVADQTVILPSGEIVNAGIEAAAGGQSILPLIVNAHEQMAQANGGTL